MKKITKIGPLSKQVFLSSIEQGYLTNVKTDRNPLTIIQGFLLTNSISINRITINPLSVNQSACLTYLEQNFDSIIISNPQGLVAHMGAIDNTLFGALFKNKFRLNDFGKAILAIFNYDDYFRTKAKKGLWLAGQLNLKSCPYCNSQYTLVVKKNSKGLKAKFQFDHFFSKKRFPYLSLSLYNLIPSCAQCNLNKGDKLTNLISFYHPYELDMAVHSRFHISYPVQTKQLTVGDVSKLNITVKFEATSAAYKTLVEDHNKLFDIETSYNRHTDIAEDLLYKAIVNNSSFKKDVLKINGLFPNPDVYDRYVIGNYSRPDEILDRPLAKFTQDIARQLKLIK